MVNKSDRPQLRGQHVQSALSEDEKGESILNLDDILQDVGLMYIYIIHKVYVRKLKLSPDQ